MRRLPHLLSVLAIATVLGSAWVYADNPRLPPPSTEEEDAATARRKAFEVRQKQEQDRNEAYWLANKIVFAGLRDSNVDVRIWIAEKIGGLAEQPKYARNLLEMMKIDKDERVLQAVKKSLSRLDELEKEIQKNAVQSPK